MKILTIIIPSYNMEALLERCLNSFIAKDLENLEVIIVNDGSKDNTILIANKYYKLFPEIVVLIDKKNGNYGSCINEALKIAKGKYVKILDADDWFDKNAFLSFYAKIKRVECDLILSDFNHIINEKSCQVKKIEISEEIIHSDEILSNKTILNLDMHAMAYRRDMLLDNGYRQTEGISYTDQEWIFYPMEFVQSIFYIKENVYQYYLGREGQTMDPKVEIKKINDKVIILKKMILHYKDLKLGSFENKNIFLKYRILEMIKVVYKNYLLLQENDSKISELQDLDYLIGQTLPDVYEEMNLQTLHAFFPYRYIKEWRRTKKMTPKNIRFINSFLKKIQNTIQSIKRF